MARKRKDGHNGRPDVGGGASGTRAVLGRHGEQVPPSRSLAAHFLVGQSIDRATFDAMCRGRPRSDLPLDRVAAGGFVDQSEAWAALARGLERGHTGTEPSKRARLAHAINGLRIRYPHFSAASGLWAGQAGVIAVILVAVCLAFSLAFLSSIAGVMLLATLVFIVAGLVRTIAISEILVPLRMHRRVHRFERAIGDGPPLVDSALPSYGVLVPMFREAAILADTVAALERLDYPRDLLDIVLVCEADDSEMVAALSNLRLPGFIRAEFVPPAHPRTKPKALNYALATLRTDLVVIYDAEDYPAPDQLRRAAAILSRSSSCEIGCLQAQLNIYNWDDTWLTRQFAIEYSALFDGLLPAFERLGLPLPLGGTSNHFRRRMLEHVGAWDPFNVTEDADLGLRMCRMGFPPAVLESTTLEEAPRNFRTWFKQRSRWIKGWFQTYAVHMRTPRQLYRELGAKSFLGFQLLALGLFATVLLHPISYIGLIVAGLADVRSPEGAELVIWAIWGLAGFNMVFGIATVMLLGAFAAMRRGLWAALPSVLLMPVYWLLISFAAYAALFQLVREVRAPVRWEKTDHRPRRRRERHLLDAHAVARSNAHHLRQDR